MVHFRRLKYRLSATLVTSVWEPISLLLCNHYITVYGSKHLAKKVFTFEVLYIIKKGDHLVSYDLKSGYCDVSLHPLTRRFVGIKWEGVYYIYVRAHVPPVWALNYTLGLLQGDEGDGGEVLEEIWDKKPTLPR